MNQALTHEQAIKALTNEDFLNAQNSTFLGFWISCFAAYQTLPPADFHPRLIADLDNDDIDALNVMGFRGGAKSSIGSLAYAIYAGATRKFDFIILCSETDDQALLMAENVRMEFETNEMIRAIHGDLVGKREWGKQTFVLANGVRYMIRSRGQKFRGLRHRHSRPGLVVIDDPEDRKWVQKKANRDFTERWITGDVIPGMARKRKIVVLSNMIHTDCLGARLERNKRFVTRKYDIIENGRCAWRARFPTKEALAAEKALVGHTAWMREYRLKVVPDEGQVVKESWIVKYKEMHKEFVPILSITGVDLAISKNAGADSTAMVSILAGLIKGQPKIYVLPHPVNEQMSLGETVDRAALIQRTNPSTIFKVEGVAFQLAAVEMMRKAMINVEVARPIGDKRARLQTVSPKIQDGTIEFSETGNEDLISQIVNFGIEEHDDLMDAFVYAILAVIEKGISEKTVMWI